MSVLNYEGLSYLYDKLIAHFANQNDVTQNFDKVESDIKIINTTLATKQNQTQVQNLIDASINKLVDGAPDALNTLNELAAALGDDKDYYKTINELINGIKNTLNTKASADELGAHVANKANPHEVTIVEEGEGNIVSSFENGAQIVAHKDAYGFSKKEGNIVQENCLEEMPIRVKTVLEPIQSGSGDPYPAGGGKNLLNPKLVGGNEAYVSVTIDGRWRINNTSGGAIYLANEWVKLPAGNYCFQTDSNVPNLLVYIQKNSDDYSVYISDGIQTKTVYVSDGEQIRVLCVVPAGTSTTVSIWAAKGANSTHYAPYANIRPISGHTGAKLTRCGKNLLPTGVSQTTNGVTFTVNTDGSVTVNGTATADTFFGNPFWNMTFEPAVNYFLSGCPQNNLGLYMAVINGPEDHGSGALIRYNENFGDGIRIVVLKGTKLTNALFYPKIELGVAATAYEPYQGDTFALDFGQTVYGGTLDWNKGVLTVDRAIVTLTGTENFQFSSGGTGRFVYYGLQNVIKPFSNSTIVAPIVCSHYKPSTADYLYNTPDAYAIAQNNGTEIWFSDTGFDSPSAFKAYLSAQNAAGTPVQVCYKLAKPYTIQLSPHQIKSLKGINTIYSSDGISSVVFNAESLNYNTTPISIEQTNNLITVENGLDGYGFKATSIIEPQQAGSGDPYPAGGGKNLLNYDLWKTVKINDGTAVWQDNGVILTANNADCYTRYSASDFPCAIPVNTGDTIVMSWEHSGAEGLVYIFGNGGTSSMTNVYSSVKTLKYVVPNGITFITVRLGVQGTGNTATYKNVQVEKGTTATAYAPYSNIRTICGYTGCDVTRCGKNLFDKDSAILNAWYSYSPDVSDAVTNGGEGLFASKLIPVHPGDVFTLTNYLSDGSVAMVKYLAGISDTSGTNSSPSRDQITCDGTKQTYTFTIPDRVRYIGITGDMANIDKVQLELGSAATAYTPYQGEIFTSDFGKNLVVNAVSSGFLNQYNASLYLDMELLPNTTYTLSFIATPGNNIYINEYITKIAYLSTTGVRQSITFTTKETLPSEQYVSGSGWPIFKNGVKQTVATTYTDVQCELGYTATEYYPYNANLLAKTGGMIYGGTLDWNKGVLTVDMGYAVFNSSENWVVYTYADGKKSFYTSGTGKLSGIADRFISIPGLCSWTPTAEDGCIRDVLRTDVGSTEIEIKPDVLSKWGINDLDTFKARLAANPMQIAYQLATPITIQLTPQHLTMLQGKNNFYSNSSTLKIKTNTSIENYYTLESFNLPSVDDFLTKNSTISIINGGTGATTAASARTNLGITPANIGAVSKTGDTITGALNFANNVWNAMGDDAYIGDYNQSGMIGIKGKNGATGIYFAPYSGSTAQTITTNGSGTMTISGTVAGTFSGNLSGNASTATKLATARTISLTGDVTGSTTFDGNSNVSIAATVANDSHTHSQSTITPYVHNAMGTEGATGYVKFATLNITNTYANEPIVFELSRRQATTTCTLYVAFASANTTDPELGKFTFIGQDYDCYIYKSATSTWDLYCRKAEGYDQVGVVRYHKPSYMAGTKVTWTNTLASSYPTGATKAVVGGYIATAATSNSCSGNASTATKVNNNLTIKLNSGTTEGTNLFTFNGSAGKTINITPSAIGAAAASHGTHLSLGTTSSTAFRGDYGNTAYTHSQSAHAPTNAQKNSDITKAEIEAKLTGTITSHAHNYAGTSHGTHVSYGTSASAIAKTASAGSASTVSRSDHVHSLPLNLIYPVGSIYMSVNSTSPATLFGGTWEQIQDKFLLSAGSTYSAGSTGGEARHTLTIDETPAHNHTPIDSAWHFNQTKGGLGASSIARKEVAPNSSSSIWVIAQTGGNYDDLATTNTTNTVGASGAHNNMPPYLTVYMWKRTA